MDKESLDFGTIAVYTCEKSVGPGRIKPLSAVSAAHVCYFGAFSQCASAPAPAFTPADDSFARFAPVNGWEEEVAFVQNYSLRGVQFR